MSRFEKFQNIQVRNEKNEPLNGQIYLHDCIINFKDGFINDGYGYDEDEETYFPAISCIDGHVEYWEKGVLNLNPTPVDDDEIEDEENDQKESYTEKNEEVEELSKERGEKAEIAFANYLDKNKIPFIHLDQPMGALYSDVLRNRKIKRPDYIIFIDKRPFFIDVKFTRCYTINKKELRRLNALKNEFAINVIFAVTDKIGRASCRERV